MYKNLMEKYFALKMSFLTFQPLVSCKRVSYKTNTCNLKLKIILLLSKITFRNVKLKSIPFPVSILCDFEVKKTRK